MSEDSYIQVGSDNMATTFVGADAINLFRAGVLRGVLNLYASCGIIPTRGVTITKMLTLATTYTGKKYSRNMVLQAVADITIWIEAMKAAIPIEHKAIDS